MELPNEQEIIEPPPNSNVFQLFDPTRRLRGVQPATPDELTEYRKYWPLMMQMLREWEVAKNPKQGCPILANVLAPPPE